MDTMETALRLAGVIRESIVDGPAGDSSSLRKAARIIAPAAKTHKRMILLEDMTARLAI